MFIVEEDALDSDEVRQLIDDLHLKVGLLF